MFGMEVFCTFPSNYVEAQKHGNERRIKIGDFNSQADGDETLQTGKPAMEEIDVDKLQEDLMLSGRDTQLLMRDKNCPNQSKETQKCSMETKWTWTNQDATPTTEREEKLQEWMRSKWRDAETDWIKS
ncbi:unnamed protein product [Microthlaspi erraticum]|uniref:Uncharacterized protein n=1 Tax=Microthlaspi erraticum TaxID=1685480 RepID=A0A6D2JW15_9BRAS|nr:unnamed protein product [Microthlaspi erraticum]